MAATFNSFGNRRGASPLRDRTRHALLKQTSAGQNLEERFIFGSARAMDTYDGLTRQLTKAEKENGTHWTIESRSQVGKDRLRAGLG